MRSLVFAVLLGLAAPTLGQAAEPPVWYAERISTGDAPVRIQHFWSKGPRLRSETVFLGHPIVTIVSGERYIVIDRLTRSGVAIQRSPRAIQEDAKRGRPFGNELQGLLGAGGEKVRTEEMAGRACDLYRVTDGEGRREVCVTQDEERLPLFGRVWLRESGQSAESRYLEWSRDLEIHDAFFEPGPGVTLEHVGYDEYVRRAPTERIGPAPPLHADLLHGS
jgi:hypothetical protein